MAAGEAIGSLMGQKDDFSSEILQLLRLLSHQLLKTQDFVTVSSPARLLKLFALRTNMEKCDELNPAVLVDCFKLHRV